MKTIRIAIVASLLAALSACGGGEEECRPDIMGPPAPEVADLPICGEVQP